MGEDTFAFGEQNHHDPITDPILIDIGFDKTQGRNGAIIHPYLVLGTLPDKLWHVKSPDLFAEESISGATVGETSLRGAHYKPAG